MKKIIPFLLLPFCFSAATAQKTAIPHLEKKGNTTQLIVQGKPFLILGGELHNSSTSGAAYMRSYMGADEEKKSQHRYCSCILGIGGTTGRQV